MTDMKISPQELERNKLSVSRREMLLGMTAATTAAFSSAALSASGHDHHKQDHSKHAPQQPD